MKLSKLFGISALITGAFAITGNLSPISHTGSSTTSTLFAVTVIPDIPVTAFDAVHISLGTGEHCNMTTFDREHYMHIDMCYGQDQPFTTIRSRFVPGDLSATNIGRCVLVTFSDTNCTTDGAIISQYSYKLGPDEEEKFEPFSDPSRLLEQPDCSELWTQRNGHRIQGHSAKWVCEYQIDETWADLFPAQPLSDDDDDDDDDLPISARSIDPEHSKDHVVVSPADGFNCNSAQHRDTDTKLQGHCHPFDKPFFSLRASVKRADENSVFGGSQPCEVLAFSDNKCRRDGASIVNLLNTTSLGVCHNVTLHHGKDVAAIAGHSWKWICGRQNIDDCLKPVHHSKARPSAATSTAISGGATKTVTATTSLACSITTDFAHYFDVVTSLITLKPVTHVSTSVFTKTKVVTRVSTQLITSVATDVSTVLHSVTKPYKTTYMVCDVHETPRA
ncbi:hypothetical protein M436DRAFT_65874 [Aureobasidium namibiae CBS 147.97]|uniref:Uncharacterized protein n=1 Tax=Aureobasidium namibiae CBS 147.97 TaxID=1043004 RepID=A0A074WDJ4_9PEZI